MKKIYLSFALLFALAASAQIVNIPDPVFKDRLVNQFFPTIDTNHDDEIQVSEALATTRIDVYYADIYDLTGLEAFTNLTRLNITGIHLSGTLDLSFLPNLQILECADIGLTGLNLTGLTQLNSIDCSTNELTSLDLSTLTNLGALIIRRNPQLGIPSLAGLNNLVHLDCGLSGLTAINISNLPMLQRLICDENNLTSLTLSNLPNLNLLNCAENQLSNVEFSALPNLTELQMWSNHFNTLTLTNPLLTIVNCASNEITTLDVSALSQLTSLDCGFNLLTSLNVNNLTSLTFIKAHYNLLTGIDVSNLVNLTELEISSNPIPSVDVSTLVNLRRFGCCYNELTTLDVSHNLMLEQLQCHHNMLTAVNFGDNLHQLGALFINDNLFSSLDLSHIPSSLNLEFYNNPNLIDINLKNGLPVYAVRADNCPLLVHICIAEQYINSFTAQLAVWNSQASVSSYCTFVPGGSFNTVSGVINECAPGTIPYNGFKIKINDNNTTGVTFTDASGHYSFYTQSGNFTVTPQLEHPYFELTPVSATVNFTNSNNNTQTRNFCLLPIGVHHDTEITIVPLQNARPGFDAHYKIIFKNKGNQIESGNVTLLFDDSVLDLVSANPAVSNQTVNSLAWNYSNLMPFETRQIDFTMNVNSPMEIPAVNLDDVLTYTASIDPAAGSETPEDDVFELRQIVTGSFDPNDKTCLEGTTMVPENVGDYLHYVIRFQNSGTAAAENIVVKDLLDPAKFEVGSFRIISSSHPHNTRITGNKVEFIFEGINLPAAITDEVASHGYVAFKVKTNNTLVLGNSVSNIADIYFDYNFPITTEPAVTTVALLANNTFEDSSISIFPNPTIDNVTINAKGNITSVALFDLQGRLLQTSTQNQPSVSFSLGTQASGVYFLKVYTEKGGRVEKIIRK